MAPYTPQTNPYFVNAYQQGNALMNSVGVYNTPQQNSVQIGYSNSGKPVYSDAALLKNNDGSLGAKSIDTIKAVFDPFQVFGKQDVSALDAIRTTSSDAAFIAQLTALKQQGNSKGFVEALGSRLQQPIVSTITNDPQNQAGLNSAFSAYQLFNHWDQMSNAQKGLGVANLGIQGYKFATGENFASKPIIAADPATGTPGLTVGQGLQLFNAGYNTYALAKNWNQYNTIQKVLGGANTTTAVASTAKSLNLLGAGTQGAEVAGVTQASLAQAGFTPAPALGVGAISGGPASAVPAGYTAVGTAQGGGVIAIPSGTVSTFSGTTGATVSSTGVASASSSSAASAGSSSLASTGGSTAAPGALGEGGMSLASGGEGIASSGTTTTTTQAGASTLGAVAGGVGVAAGAYTVYKGWGQGGKAGAINGAAGGVAIAAGLNAMGYALGPWGWAAIIAVSIASNATTVGKSKDQNARDAVRAQFHKLGAVDDTISFRLPDGTIASAGQDGLEGRHLPKDLSKVPEGQVVKKELDAWDADYTNDLDYTAAMGGVALSRMVSGGIAKSVDQVGSQIGNAALKNIGFGKEYTPENYAKLMNNMRSIYSQSGIKSKEDAFQLANMAFAEHRIGATDLIAAQQSFNMIFDDTGQSYDTAQKLMAGRWPGINAVGQVPSNNTPNFSLNNDTVPAPVNRPVVKLNQGARVSADGANNLALTSKEAVRARNKQQYEAGSYG